MTVNLARLLTDAARWFPDRPAVTWGVETTTYGELDKQVVALDG